MARGDGCQDLLGFIVAMVGAGLLLLMPAPAQRGATESGVAAAEVGPAGEEVSDDVCAAR